MGGQSVVGRGATHSPQGDLRPCLSLSPSLGQHVDGLGVAGGGEGDSDHPVREIRHSSHAVKADLGAVAQSSFIGLKDKIFY